MPPVFVQLPGWPEVENLQPGVVQDASLTVNDRP